MRAQNPFIFFFIALILKFACLPFAVKASGICPQKRTTRTAPGSYIEKINPIPKNPETLSRGKQLYFQTAKPTACKMCHGIRGNGNGRLAPGLEPPPRNFSCDKTMKPLSDGQLFWIIQNGSKHTAMPAHKKHLTSSQIWELVHFIKAFSK